MSLQRQKASITYIQTHTCILYMYMYIKVCASTSADLFTHVYHTQTYAAVIALV